MVFIACIAILAALRKLCMLNVTGRKSLAVTAIHQFVISNAQDAADVIFFNKNSRKL